MVRITKDKQEFRIFLVQSVNVFLEKILIYLSTTEFQVIFSFLNKSLVKVANSTLDVSLDPGARTEMDSTSYCRHQLSTFLVSSFLSPDTTITSFANLVTITGKNMDSGGPRPPKDVDPGESRHNNVEDAGDGGPSTKPRRPNMGK